MSTTIQDTGLRTGTWIVDPEHSHVGFSVKHLGIATVHGSFSEYNGKIIVDKDGSFLVDGMVGTKSVYTGNKNRDIHIRSDEDFFQVERYPFIHLRADEIQPAGKGMYVIYGELSLHGRQRKVEWQMYLNGYATDPAGKERMGISVEGRLNRKDWNMDWNQLLEVGGFLVSDQVRLHMDFSLILQS
mgnify:CR=1 FL=1